MGKNKFENFIFSLITCIMMVFFMTWYNGILENGANINIMNTIITFFPICLIAFIIDWFIVGNIAKRIAGIVLKKDDSIIKKVLIMTFLMVLGMSLAMSFLSTLAHGHLGPHFLFAFRKIWLTNFPVALFLNFLIVGPIARNIFFKLFPPKPISI